MYRPNWNLQSLKQTTIKMIICVKTQIPKIENGQFFLPFQNPVSIMHDWNLQVVKHLTTPQTQQYTLHLVWNPTPESMLRTYLHSSFIACPIYLLSSTHHAYRRGWFHHHCHLFLSSTQFYFAIQKWSEWRLYEWWLMILYFCIF